MFINARPLASPLLLLTAAVLLTACATPAVDGGFGPVADLTRERTGQAARWQRSAADVQAAQARVAALLVQPLTADASVEVALLNNPTLQARFAALGVADAERVAAGRLRNPSFTFGRLGGGTVEIDRSLTFDVLGLLALPWTSEWGARQLQQAQLQAADAAVALAAEVRRAHINAVAAQELLQYAHQVHDAASAAGELAQRMQAAGNFSALAQMREQAFQADANLRLVRAGQQVAAGREQLARLLGLHGAQLNFQLPGRLPRLPSLLASTPASNAGQDNTDAPLQQAEQAALDQRLDVRAATLAASDTAQALGLTRSTRLVNVLDVGYQNKSTTGEPRQNGYTLTLELPLFDFGSTRVAQAEARYMQAVQHAASVAADARADVRAAFAAHRSAHALAALYRDEIIPLKQRVSEQQLLHYNGMLISVFDLLADARDQVQAVTGHVEALRDFWLADADLQAAMAGRVPSRLAGGPPGN